MEIISSNDKFNHIQNKLRHEIIDLLGNNISYPHVYLIIQMSSIEIQLYSIYLPEFIVNFKDSCIRWTLPLLDSCISYVEKADSAFLFLILFALLAQIYRTLLVRDPSSVKQEKDNTQNRQIGKEIKDLKKELKSIQNMLHELKSSSLEQQKQTSNIGVPQKDTLRLINYCKQSWQKREQIATQIMDWQLKIIKQVTKLKNKNRSSRSPSKNQISSTKQLSAQSKKSIKSTIHHIEVHEENKALFQSDIKIKEEEIQPNKPEEKPARHTHTHQETVIQVKIENQGPQPISSSLNIQLHQKTKQIEKSQPQVQQQILIEPSFQKANEIQKPQQAQIEQKKVLTVPPMKSPLPRPSPLLKKQTKRPVFPPPSIKR